ncbi:uncharacterized protein V1518DRAFT_432890 [Limtongia smithiae]|uniref:uncharacterized protein n=1 Tax=Limtongia smithiae TaxID=1125753 RepID=UPI0034CF9B26
MSARTEPVVLTEFPRLAHVAEKQRAVLTTEIQAAAHEDLDTAWSLILRAWGEILYGSSHTSVVEYDATTQAINVDKLDGDLDGTSDSLIVAFNVDVDYLPSCRLAVCNRDLRRPIIRFDEAAIPAGAETEIYNQYLLARAEPGTGLAFAQPRRSVANFPTQMVNGPKLLHNFLDFHSHAVALEFMRDDGRRYSYSYAELGHMSGHLATKLRDTTGDIVPLLMSHSPEMYVGVLGILRAGKAFCPIIPEDTPFERLLFLLKDVGASVVICSKLSAHILDGVDVKCLIVDAHEPPVDHDDFVELPITTDDVAYCMFTSGSTGQPKGVLVTHGNATQAILAHNFVPEFKRFLNFASLSFDVSVLEIFLPWLRGKTLVSACRSLLHLDLASTMRELAVDACELTPTVAGLLTSADVPNLRYLLTIGEKLTRGVIETFGSSGALFNTYGPTEATIQCTAALTGTGADFLEGDIGVPLAPTGIIISDVSCQTDIKPLPVGWLGELVICGAQVAKGYLNRPELTASVFINDSVYGKCYRTGDMARILPNGRIYFLGRILDQQTKIRGRRIELGEIEYACKVPAVAMVYQNRIFVVVEGSEDPECVLENCGRILPRYAIPDRVLTTTNLPLLPSGKANRKAAVKFVTSTLEQEIGYKSQEYHMSSTEAALAEIVKNLTGVYPGIDVQLRSCGVDSFVAMRLTAEARRVLPNFSIRVPDIWSGLTLRQAVKSASVVEQLRPPIEQIELPQNSLSSDIVCAFQAIALQRAMSFEWRTDNRLYSNFVTLKIDGSVSSQRIIDCVRQIIDANEILRTGFVFSEDADVYQIVYADSSHFQIVDCAVSNFVFASLKYPPFVASIHEVGGDWLVEFRLHHIIYDGWAFDLFVADLDALLRNHDIPKRPQFRDAMPYLTTSDDSLQFWRDYLSGQTAYTFPMLVSPRSTVTCANFTAKSELLNIDVDFSALRRVCSHLNISPQSVFHFAWARVLNNLRFASDNDGAEDVLFGIVVSRRTELAAMDLDSAMGPMLSILPFRVPSAPESDIAESLKYLSSKFNEILRHSDIQLGDVVKLFDCATATSPLGSLFVWQQSNFSKLHFIEVIDSLDSLEFDMMLEVVPMAECAIASITYHGGKFSNDNVNIVLNLFAQCVQSVFSAIGLSSIESGDMDNWLAIDNPSPFDFNTQQETITDILDLHGDVPALEIVSEGFEVSSVSYSQVSVLVQSYASLLYDTGIGHGDAVGVVLDKSIELYVAILAVWTIGAVYVPIDPKVPSTRIRHILGQVHAKICLCSGDRDGIDNLVVIPDYVTVLSDPRKPCPVEYAISSKDTAYIIFTSGSTGIPKGVVLTHGNVVNNIKQLAELYPPPDETSKMLQFCSIGFDVSVFEIVYSLYNHLTICSAVNSFLIPNLSEVVRSRGITHLSLTPTVASLLEIGHLDSVKVIILAGEPLSRQLLKTLASTNATIINSYGPTELTNVCISVDNLNADDDEKNIGKVFRNMSCFIVDPASMKILPKTAVGELVCGGFQVAKGYFEGDDKTRENFIQLENFGRVYRTGDRARMLADGSIVLLGRTDSQVKIRGQRIELGEISTRIREVDGVTDAIATVIDNQIVAFVQTTYASDWIESLIYRHLEATLPQYMLPSHIAPCLKFGITTNGKIDTKKLCEDFKNSGTQFLTSAPQCATVSDGGTDEERDIAQALASTISDLDTGSMKLNVPLYNYGLDSVSVIRFISAMRRMGYSISLPDVPRGASIMSVAETLLQRVQQAEVSTGTKNIDAFVHEIFDYVAAEGIRNEDIQHILPASPMQDILLGSRTSYATTLTFQLGHHTNAADIEEAWKYLVTERECLRTCFVAVGKNSLNRSFAQIVLKRHDFEMRHTTINTYSEFMEGHSPTWTATEPPYSVYLLRCDDASFLVVDMHHALFDAQALNLLLHDLISYIERRTIRERPAYISTFQYIENVDHATGLSHYETVLEDFDMVEFPHLSSTSVEEKTYFHCNATASSSLLLSELEHATMISEFSLLSLVNVTWGKLLSLLCGSDDVVFGTISSGRGYFIDSDESAAPMFYSFPIRCQFVKECSNSDVLRNVEAQCEQSRKYPFVSVRDILKRVNARDGSYHKRLFDSVVVFQLPMNSDDVDPMDNTLWTVYDERDRPDLALILEIRRDLKSDSVEYFLSYDGSLVSKDQVEYLLALYDKLLHHTLDTLSECSVTVPSFEDSMLSKSDNRKRLDGGPGLHSQFEINASKYPSKNALEFLYDENKTKCWTYAELNQWANRICQYLQQFDLNIDESIPLCMPKCPEYYASMISVLKAGAAFCPLDHAAPTARMLYMLKELNARVLLVSEESFQVVSDLVESSDLQMVIVNISSLHLASTPDSPPPTRSIPDSATAYRIYTSGTTGKPKAVNVEIRNAMQTIEASRSLLPHGESSRLLQYAATTFDMSIYDCFIAWTFGFTLCSANSTFMISNLELVSNSMQISLLDLTPSVAASIKRRNVPSVETLFCIGEVLPQAVVDEWSGACYNSYGPTEAAMCCTITRTSASIKSSLIGKPFPTTTFYVLVPNGDSVLPLYSVGELVIGGYQVARGYYNNDILTAENFVNVDGERLYRTGDLVRMRGDGVFDFVGRKDDQVKLRGLRIELQEIDSVIRQNNDSVVDVSTLVLTPRKRDEFLTSAEKTKSQLVTFVVLKSRYDFGDRTFSDADSVSEREIQSIARSCREFLPYYMIPSFFVPISGIPLSAAGKLSRARLNTIFDEYYVQWLNLERPTDEENWNDVELRIRSIMCAISGLPVSSVYLDSSIYELGMDSISATQAAASLRRNGFNCSAIDILKNPTIRQLSEFISKVASTEAQRQTSALFLTDLELPDGLNGALPCTHTQEGILAKFQSSEGELYFNHVILEVPDSIAPADLREAWTRIYSYYDILRVGFIELQGNKSGCSYVQVINSRNALHWRESVTDSFEQYKYSVLRRYRQTALAHLSSAQLFLELISTSNKRYLLVAVNHAIYDGLMLDIILRDVDSALRGANQFTFEPEFDCTVAEIIDLQKKAAVSGKRYWTRLLQDVKVTSFPNLNFLTDTKHFTDIREKILSLSIEQLQDYSKLANVSIQTLGISAWSKILAAYSGESDIAFGLVLSGRTGLASASTTLYPCVTTVPFRVSIAGTNAEFLRAINNMSYDVLEYQHTPFSVISECVEGGVQFYDTVFVFQKFDDFGSNHRWKILQEEGHTEFKCSLEMAVSADQSVTVSLTYDTSFITPGQAEHILDLFDFYLQETASHLNDSCVQSAVPQSLASICPPQIREIPSDIRFLHQFVEIQAAHNPDNIAIEFASDITEHGASLYAWSYKDLDREANKIANYLLTSFDLHANDIIATCFEKSAEASFAIVGILKAGCCFLSIDPGAPSDRKRFICKDSGAHCLLTHSELLDKLLYSDLGVPVISVLSPEILATSADLPVLSFDLTSDSLCYSLYTSGSTGNPKGCLLTHKNAVQGILAFQLQFEGTWTQESKFLQFASFHFDVSVLEQFWSWSVGITLTSAPRDVILKDITLTIRKLNITHLDLTPSLAAIIEPGEVPSLCRGLFITGGDLLKREILEKWGDQRVIYNAYGPTEATIGVTMRRKAPRNLRPSNIGHQFHNVGTVVCYHGTNNPVPRGAIGELCVSGELVGLGYINRPDLTASVFSFSDILNGRLYRTGDLVRLLSDNSFEFIGRTDTQIKLRGQRLEISEINIIVKQSNSAITDVATAILKNQLTNNDQLVSFISVPEFGEWNDKLIPSGAQINSVIRGALQFCKSKLQGYMIPSYILPVSKIPLSVNNKVDHKALKILFLQNSPEMLNRYSHDAADEIWTTDEKQLRDMISEFAGIEPKQIRRGTTFFELGYDSISLVPLLKHLQQRFLSIRLSTLMKYPSIDQLSSHISEVEDDQVTMDATFEYRNYHDNAYQVLDISSDDVESIIPCTPLQDGIVARALASGPGMLYFNKFYLELDGSIEITRLRESWNAVVKEDQILRTCFMQTEIGIAQVILREWTPYWLETSTINDDWTSIATSHLEQHWQSICLSRPPLFLEVFCAPHRQFLFVGIFHALYDEVSLRVIFDDVVRVYCYEDIPRRPPFAEAVPYILSNTPLQEARSFWKQMYGVRGQRPVMQVSCESPASTLATHQSLFTFDRARKVAMALGCTPHVLFQTAFAIALAQLQGPYVCFGVVVSGRTFQNDLDNVVGPLFNTLPIALDLSSMPTYSALSAKLQSYSAAITSYQHVPLRKIQKWLNVPANESLFSALYVYHNYEPSEFESILWTEMDTKDYVTDYPISFAVERRLPDTFQYSLGYRCEYLSSEMAQYFLQSIEHSIELLERRSSAELNISTIMESSTAGKVKESAAPNAEIVETAMVDAIKQCIAQVSGILVSDISDNTTIFQCGLDSIDAIRLSVVLAKRELQAPLSAIMAYPSALLLANYLSSSKPASATHKDASEETLYFVEPQRIYAVTPFQEGILAETINSNKSRYINQDVLQLENNIDIERLGRAIKIVIQTNEIYRCRFVLNAESTAASNFGMQLLEGTSDILTITETSDELWDNCLTELMQRSVSTMELFAVPAIQATALISNAKRVILLTASHALYDGHSIGLFHSDVRAVYHTGQPISRPSFVPIWSRILRESIDTQHLEYWKSVLSGVREALFPIASAPRSSDTTHTSVCSEVPLHVAAEAAKTNGVTMQTLGQVCFGLLLSCYLNRSDVVYGTVISGRVDENDERVQFPCAAIVPTYVKTDCAIGDILRNVQQHASVALVHRYVRLSALFKDVCGGRRLFDTMFTFQKRADDLSSAVPIWQSIGGRSEVEYTLAVELEQATDALTWHVSAQQEAKLIAAQLDYIFSRVISGFDVLPESTFAEATTCAPCLSCAHMPDVKFSGFPTTVESHDEELILLVNEHNNIVPIGCSGDMVSVSTAVDTGRRMYMRARMTPDHEILYLGRVTDYARLDGEEVYLPEISAAVCSIPGVLLAETYLLDDVGLVTFAGVVCAVDDDDDTAGKLSWKEAYLKLARIVPAYILPIEVLQKDVQSIFSQDADDESTRTTKRDTLVQKFKSLEPEARNMFAYPKNANYSMDSGKWSITERVIRSILADFCRIAEESITKQTSVFQLGVDSISCIFLSQKMRAAGVSLSVSQILRGESVDGMSRILATSGDDSATSIAIQDTIMTKSEIVDALCTLYPAISKTSVKRVIPATPGQVYMLSAWQDTHGMQFMPNFTFELIRDDGSTVIDYSALSYAWKCLVDEMECLRSGFVAVPVRMSSEIGLSSDWPFVQVVFNTNEESTFSCDAVDDIAWDGTIGLVPVHLHARRDTVELTIHHALYDAWSLRMLMRRLWRLYTARRNSEDMPDQRYTEDSCEKFARAVVPANAKDAVVDYWARALEQAGVHRPMLTEITEFAQQRLIHRHIVRPNELRDAEFTALVEFARGRNVSVAAVLLAASARVIQQNYGSRGKAVVFGVYDSGRAEVVDDATASGFPMVNIHPFVVRTDDDSDGWLTRSAKAVAHTLREISERVSITSTRTPAQVGVWEMWDLVGPVDCAVNILEDIEDDVDTDGGVRKVDTTADEARMKINTTAFEESVASSIVQGRIRVRTDIEFAISRKCRQLSIGVFCNEREGEMRCEQMMAWIVKLLRGL